MEEFNYIQEFSDTITGGSDGGRGFLPGVEDPNIREIKIRVAKEPEGQVDQTWIVVHGWNSSTNPDAENIYALAEEVTANAGENDRVLALDWSEASNVAGGRVGVLGGSGIAATWIAPTAEKTVEILEENFGINSTNAGQKLNLIGHSLGSFVSAEIGRVYGSEVRTITALDPASDANVQPDGYDVDGNTEVREAPANFAETSKFSRSFVGATSIAGSERFASNADESYQLDFGSTTFGESIAEHGRVVATFANIFGRSNKIGDLLGYNSYQSLDTLPIEEFGVIEQGAFSYEGIINVDNNDEPNSLTAQAVTGDNDQIIIGDFLQDEIIGREGNDSLFGEGNNDNLIGDGTIFQSSNDTLDGGEGEDVLEGRRGNDSLLGGDNNDELKGQRGNDILDGGAGNDALDGGADEDTAVFSDNIGNYEYSIDNDTITLDHFQGTQTDGTDTLTNIEFAQFSDRLVSLPLEEPTDVVFLQDLSSSFEEDLPVLQSLANPLVDTLLEENSDTFFGVASFIDQPLEPFGAPGDFIYRTNLPITDSESSVIATINSLSTGDGGDDPEAQLTALLEVATRTEELGYRDDSTRYVFLSTDASFQQGADYPNIAQVKTALEDNNVVPIFLVTSDVTGVYQGLANSLGRGEVVTLTNNSSNVTDAVRLAFAEIEGEVTALGTDGDDNLTGDATDEGIFGGLGDDTIDGLGGDDILDGGAGDDELNGSAGDDELNGGTGEDIIDGGSGSDLIEGGLDADVLTGSAAADTFAGTLDELDGDVITDFTEDDRILVRDADFTEENLTVTEGSAILDIDVDSDETIDSTITLEGDFTDSSFVVESESFEDITNTIITISESLPPSQIIEDVIDLSNSDNQSVTFTVSRSAAFNNTVDFYEINADGSVENGDGSLIAIGEAGYQDVALAQRIGLDLTSPNGQSTEYSVELEGGNIYAPLLVVNNDFSELTDKDTSNDPNVFFPYAEANIDNFDHIRSQGNLTFEFEDLLNGGNDSDFDDIIVEVLGLNLETGIGEVPTESVFGTPDADVIEVMGVSQQINALAGNDTIDASVGNGGNRIEAGSGDDTVILGTSDFVVGGEGDDSFFASRSGSNVITGEAGSDQFWIVDTVIPESVNIITDFTGGEDVIGIAGLGIGFEELSISQTGDNTLISTDEEDLVILQNVEAASLGNADFAFT